MSDNNQQAAVMSKQTIDSKGLQSTPFSHEDHINGDGSLLTAMAVTRDELAILAAHYQTQIDDYETDRERYPEDGISSREWRPCGQRIRRRFQPARQLCVCCL